MDEVYIERALNWQLKCTVAGERVQYLAWKGQVRDELDGELLVVHDHADRPHAFCCYADMLTHPKRLA